MKIRKMYKDVLLKIKDVVLFASTHYDVVGVSVSDDDFEIVISGWADYYHWYDGMPSTKKVVIDMPTDCRLQRSLVEVLKDVLIVDGEYIFGPWLDEDIPDFWQHVCHAASKLLIDDADYDWSFGPAGEMEEL